MRMKGILNPRPFSVFRQLHQWRGEVGTTTPRVSKLSVVELSAQKNSDCSRRVLAMAGAFFMLGEYMTQLLEVKRQIIAKSTIFNFICVCLKNYES